MASRSLIVEIGANVARLRQDMNKSSREVSRFTSSASSAFKGLGAAIGAYLSYRAVTAAVRGISSFIQDVTNAAAEEELAQKKLATALGFTSQALLDQASALQQVTTFADDAIVSAQALIAAFTKSEAATITATKATLDLAAGAGMQLKDAANLVSKTLGSTTNALSRYGITVEGAVGSTARLESFVKNVSKVFGGQAAAEAETYSGRVKQIANAWSDVKEELGRAVTESAFMTGAAGLLKEAIEDLGKWVKANKEDLKDLVRGGVLFAVDAFLFLVQTVDLVAGAYRNMKLGMTASAEAILASHGDVEAASGKATQEIIENNKEAEASWAALTKRVSDLRDRMTNLPTGTIEAPKVTGKISGFGLGAEDIERKKELAKSFAKFDLDTAMEYDKAIIEGHAAMNKMELDGIRETIAKKKALEKEFTNYAIQDAMEYDKAIIEGHAATNKYLMESDAEVRAYMLDGYEAQKEGAREYLNVYTEMWLNANRSIMSYTAEAAQTIYTGLSAAISDVIMGAKTMKEAFKAFGQMIIKMIVDWVVQRVVASVISKALGAAEAAAQIAAGAAVAAAWAPAAAAVSLATFGANSAPAIAGMIAAYGTAGTLSKIPGFAEGGFIPATPGGRIIRVAEGGEGEHIIPESKVGAGPMVINLHVDGTRFFQWIQDGHRQGRLKLA